MYVIQDGVEVLSATSTDQISWSYEPGVRLSTGLPTDLDGSSITACAVYSTGASSWRMLYSAVSSTGTFSILSATSLDGLTWTKEAGVRVFGGATLVASPKVIPTGATKLRLYYVRANSGMNQVWSSTSSDQGVTWGDEGVRISTSAGEISVSSLTDSRVRLLYSSLPAGSTTALQILSAISSDGLSFSFEAGVPVSTSASAGSADFPLIVRSTETFRWRLFYAFLPAGASEPVVVSALTLLPTPVKVIPNTSYNNANSAFTLTGEVFGSSPTVTFVQGATSIPATGVTAVSDLVITGVFPSSGAALGKYDVKVTNPDANSGTLSQAFSIIFPPGVVILTDNLIRPLKGDKTRIDITIFNPGNVTAKLYTLTGELVKTVLDQPEPIGTTTLFWPGDTGGGHTVASGTYLLHVEGPSTKTTKKIVVIK
jgi:hypothetical protein